MTELTDIRHCPDFQHDTTHTTVEVPDDYVLHWICNECKRDAGPL